MTPQIHVAITSHNLADADAFGEFVAASAREYGFKDVSIDTANQSEFTEGNRAIIAMRALNPDIFSYPVRITTDQADSTPPPDEGPEEDGAY